MIRGDRAEGKNADFCSSPISLEALGQQSKALASVSWKDWGFVATMCGGRRLRGDVHRLHVVHWIADARLVLNMLKMDAITNSGNSFGGWIAG